MGQFFRTVFLQNRAYLMMADYPDQCPHCGADVSFDEYGVHVPEWDDETVAQVVEGTAQGRMVKVQGVADCAKGHPLGGEVVMRASTESEAENQFEFQCVAQTFARSHAEVADVLGRVGVVRVAPGIYMPPKSVILDREGLVPPVILGEECNLATTAEVGPATFVHRSNIGAKCKVRNCVVIDSTVDGGGEWKNAAIIRSFVDDSTVPSDPEA